MRLMKDEQWEAVWQQMDLREQHMTILYWMSRWDDALRDHILNMRKKYLGW